MYHSTYYLPKDFSLEIDKVYKNHREITYDNEFDIYKNAIISLTNVPMREGIFSENLELMGTYLDSDDTSQLQQQRLTPNQKINLDTINKISETVIYGGLTIGHFGHFITDTLNRLWYPIKHREQKYKIVFIYYQHRDYNLGKFQNEFIKLLGIDTERIVIIDEPTYFEKVVVPKQSVYWDSSYNKELLSLIYDTLVSNVTPNKYEKIYISKAKVNESDSFTVNEAYFESFFASKGYEIIYPEQLSVYEQISYMLGAKEIACTSGTLCHQVMFANQNIKLICLMRSNLDLGVQFINRQAVMNIIKNVNCTFVDVSLNFLPLISVNNTHLIGPSKYWQDFLKNEYGIECDIDIYKYLDDAQIKIGGYLKEFIKNINVYQFGYIGYYLSMLRTYEPDEYNKNLVKLYSNDELTANSFKFKKINEIECCILRLTKDGSIKIIKGNTLNEEYHWIQFRGRLYFLNSRFRAVTEFIICNMDKGSFIKKKRFLGFSIIKSKEAYELIEIKHKFLRILIKVLVSEKKYKKLKKDPVAFFKDSRSWLIKFLGNYYY